MPSSSFVIQTAVSCLTLPTIQGTSFLLYVNVLSSNPSGISLFLIFEEMVNSVLFTVTLIPLSFLVLVSSLQVSSSSVVSLFVLIVYVVFWPFESVTSTYVLLSPSSNVSHETFTFAELSFATALTSNFFTLFFTVAS